MDARPFDVTEESTEQSEGAEDENSEDQHDEYEGFFWKKFPSSPDIDSIRQALPQLRRHSSVEGRAMAKRTSNGGHRMRVKDRDSTPHSNRQSSYLPSSFTESSLTNSKECVFSSKSPSSPRQGFSDSEERKADSSERKTKRKNLLNLKA